MVKKRGTISKDARRALKAEEFLKKQNPSVSSTTINYLNGKEFESFREDVEAHTTLKGARKILKEAIFEYLAHNKLVSLPDI